MDNLIRSERGIALVLSLLMMLVLLLTGAGLAISSRGGINVSTSFRNQQTSFEAALAGLEQGREAVRAKQFANSQVIPVPAGADKFTALLGLAADGGADVTNSVDLANFGATDGFTGTPDRPVVANDGTPIVSGGIAAVGAASYRTFITNDAAETASTIVDNNGTITLTAFGSDANKRGYSVVQAVYAPRDLTGVPPMEPGLIMPGPTVSFLPGSSNAQDFSGDGGSPRCYPAVAVTTQAAATSVKSQIYPGPPSRASRYTTCDPLGGASLDAASTHSSVENVIDSTTTANPYDSSTGYAPYLEHPCDGTPNPNCSDPHYFVKVGYYLGIRATYTSAADFLIGPADGSGTASVTLNSTNLGTEGAPRITVASGSDITLSPGNYGGALVITLNSTTGYVRMPGNFSFTGNIYVLGNARVLRNGAGSGVYCGGMAIANTNVPFSSNPALVGTPTLEVTGGGAHFQGPVSSSPTSVSNCTSATDPNYIRWGNPLNRLSFQQLR